MSEGEKSQKYTARVRRGFAKLLPAAQEHREKVYATLNKQEKADVDAAIAYLTQQKE